MAPEQCGSGSFYNYSPAHAITTFIQINLKAITKTLFTSMFTALNSHKQTLKLRLRTAPKAVQYHYQCKHSRCHKINSSTMLTSSKTSGYIIKFLFITMRLIHTFQLKQPRQKWKDNL